MRILLLYNADVTERLDNDDTLLQAELVYTLLNQLGHQVIKTPWIENMSQMMTLIQDTKPTVVFNLVEYFQSSDQYIYRIPAFFETLGIPCTGCSSMALALTANKLLAKQLLQSYAIPTPGFLAPDYMQGLCQNPQYQMKLDNNRSLTGPFIVKSQTENASFGLSADSIVSDQAQANRLMKNKAETLGGEWFAESYIDGREMNVALMGRATSPHILPVQEIIFDDFPAGIPRIYDYTAKWDMNSPQYKNVYRRTLAADEAQLALQLKQISLACWQLFRLSGYARVDFRIDENGNPYVLEINANPSIMDDSNFAAAARAEEFDLLEVVEHIVQASV